MKNMRLIPPYQLTSAVVIVILYLTLLPKPFGEEELPLFPGADKIAHCCMFGGLAITFIFERFRMKRPLGIREAVLACLEVSVFGIVIEFVQQGMNAGRSGDIFDAVADIFGAFAAIPLAMLLHWIDVVVKNRTK